MVEDFCMDFELRAFFWEIEILKIFFQLKDVFFIFIFLFFYFFIKFCFKKKEKFFLKKKNEKKKKLFGNGRKIIFIK